MKKSIVILAVLAFAMNLSAAILSCESKKGKCVYEVSAASFTKDCICSNGHGISEAELASVARGENGDKNWNSWYQLENDIVITSKYWTPIGGNSMYTFSGVFDGNGHTISGITINHQGYDNMGLFGLFNRSVQG